MIENDGKPWFDSGFREFKGFHCIANAPVESHSNACNIYHITPVAEHFKCEFTGCDDKEDLFIAVLIGDFKNFFANIMDRWNKEGNDIFFRERMDGLSDKTLLADRIG